MKYLDLAIANETIKTTDIKGKEYAEVNQRIKAFRMVYPQGFIITNMESNESGICVFKATVGYYVEHNTIADNEKGKMYQDSYLEKVVLATGTAYEKEDSSFINKTSYIENCETSAVGRALGMAGFGIDVSVASAEEVANAINNQKITQEDADNYTMKFGKYKDKTLKEVFKKDPKYIDWIISNTKDENMLEIIRLTTGLAIPTIEEQKEKTELIKKVMELHLEEKVDIDEIKSKYKVENLTQLTMEQLKEIIGGE